MRLLTGLFLAICVSEPLHGSLVVVFFTPNKIVMASESRVTRTDGTLADNGCKIVSLGDDTVFANVGLIAGEGWNGVDVMKTAYRDSHRQPFEAAGKWASFLAGRMNQLTVPQREYLVRMNGQRLPLMSGYIGGRQDVMALIGVTVTLNPATKSLEPNSRHVPRCPDQDFCALGVATDIVQDALNPSAISEVRKELLAWMPPKGTSPRDYELLKAIRAMLSTKRTKNRNFKVWLPGMDSNHDSRLQRPLSYH
jgi:hypothetical protein